MNFFLKWWVSDLVKIHWFWMSTYVKMIDEKQHGSVGKWNMSSGVMGWGGLIVFSIGNATEISKEMSFPRASVQSLRGSLAACEDRTWESPTLQGWQRRRRTLQTRCGNNHNHREKPEECSVTKDKRVFPEGEMTHCVKYYWTVKLNNWSASSGQSEMRGHYTWLEQIQEKKVNTTQEFSPWRGE